MDTIVFRSVKEALGHLLAEQARPGDFITIGYAAPGTPVGRNKPTFGRVLPETSPELKGRRPQAGKLFVKMEDGSIQEFNDRDVKVVQARDIPPEKIKTLSCTTPPKQVGESYLFEVLKDILDRKRKRNRRKERKDNPFKDREKSIIQKQAQRMPLTRLKKSDSMKAVWRDVKNRASYTGGGLKQESISYMNLTEEEQSPFRVEKKDDRGEEENLNFGIEPSKIKSEDILDSEEAWWLSQKTFELADTLIRKLAVHKGMVYFEKLEDNQEDGVVRIVLNGMCPRDIIDSFMAKESGDIDIEIVEEPEGSVEEHNLRGRWVIEARVPVEVPEEEEKKEKDKEEKEHPSKKRKYPGEVEIDEIGSEAAVTQEVS